MPIYQDYQAKQSNSQGSLLIVIATLFLAAIFTPVAFATHECKGITNEDKLLECYEQEEDEASAELVENQEKLDDVLAKISNYQNDLSATQAQVYELQNEIAAVIDALKEINKNLEERRLSLAHKMELRDSVVRAYYQSGKHSPLQFFFTKAQGTSGFGLASMIYKFDKSVTEEALKIISQLNHEIGRFEADKLASEKIQTDLEISQNNLIALIADLATKRAQAESEQAEINEEIASLEEKIATLTSKQQEILSAKAGEGTVSGYEAAEYKLPDPPYSPAFAGMSYGAYTHYNGMSQYGAKGRADEGQDYKEILEYYYEVDVEEKDDFPSEIKVDGYGEMDFQEYLYGIAEMPSDWPDDALKAQAIAARTYAYNYAKQGKTICTTQSCQVFLKSKSDNPPSKWKDAVDDTKDEILDNPKTAQYSSTTGGYLNQTGWDKDGGSWPGDAYEKKAKSPWFYKAWYTASYADNSGTCGRSTPWLNESEMADILNSWRVWKNGSSSEKDRISPITTSCWGGDPYSHGDMKEKADKYGGSFTSVSSVSVDISSGGYTSKVKLSTNRGEISIDGSEFKTVFNLRAPAYVSLRSRLFDIEMEN